MSNERKIEIDKILKEYERYELCEFYRAMRKLTDAFGDGVVAEPWIEAVEREMNRRGFLVYREKNGKPYIKNENDN